MEQFIPWLALKSVPGIGNHLFKRLTDRFKSPELVFKASSEELFGVKGISHRLVSVIQNYKIPEKVKEEIDLTQKNGFKIITLSDPDYPPLLLHIPDPPPFLYLYGNLNHSAKNIAVVGSRGATRYGISAAIRLCKDLASSGITVVSGMARGIDTAAHEGALMGNGKTIAVLGSGLCRVYPSENLKLFHKIAENGAVISEFNLMAEPAPYHFPIRNRIISGMSMGTVVVEAGKRSGALITANLATDQGRDVFAVPGNIHSFKSIGPHNLIKDGAKLVMNVQDILEELPDIIKTHIVNQNISQDKILEKLPPLTSDEAIVFKALGPYPIHIDDLIRKISMEPGKLSSILLQLELKGVVYQAPGKLFSIAVDDIL